MLSLSVLECQTLMAGVCGKTLIRDVDGVCVESINLDCLQVWRVDWTEQMLHDMHITNAIISWLVNQASQYCKVFYLVVYYLHMSSILRPARTYPYTVQFNYRHASVGHSNSCSYYFIYWDTQDGVCSF